MISQNGRPRREDITLAEIFNRATYEIVAPIWRDILDRKGLSQMWRGLDPDISQEIRSIWVRVTAAALARAMTDVLTTKAAGSSLGRAKQIMELKGLADRLREELKPIKGEGLGLEAEPNEREDP